MKTKLLFLSLFAFFSTATLAQNKLVRKIEKTQFFLTLLENKARLQSFTNPSVKGSVSAYLNAVNANPRCVRIDSFLAMQNEYYRIIDGVNNSLDGVIAVIESVNTIQDLRNLVDAKQYVDSINRYAAAAPALFLRLIKAEGQVTSCNYGSGALIIKELINLAMPFLNQIFQNRIRKVKLALIQKINQLKFDRMTAMWDAAAATIRNSSSGGNLQNLQVVAAEQGGQNELTREGAFRELGLSPAIKCYTAQQIKQAYDAKLAASQELWDDNDFVTKEEMLDQKARLINAYSFLLNLFAGANCS